MGFARVGLQLDSLTIVGMLQDKFSWCLEHATLLSKCQYLLENPDWVVRITHCLRKAIQVADRMANLGISIPFLYCESYVPPPRFVMFYLQTV